ncbi:hypothetical protein GCM10010842_40470 [Deinococcus daejeonensis]|uniref:Uncharacterized protein n=1 Tax=Deinococcus daejeonensis TaxID=1007098 RepID=A0ABQ2JLF9_9DEIO|nr:hypothetical protein GCM10010842_40470 [Deinococcus daejeonensis]
MLRKKFNGKVVISSARIPQLHFKILHTISLFDHLYFLFIKYSN